MKAGRSEMFGLFQKKTEEKTQRTAEMRILILVIALLFAALIGFTVLNIRTFSTSAATGAIPAEEAFQKTKEAKAQEVYRTYYQKSFDEAFEKYRVVNDVQINITDVRETAKLEVLEISVTEFSIVEKEDNPDHITSWLEVPVNGIYTVDLMAGEYLVDQQRRTVTIRLPRPVLEHVDIDDENEKSRLYDDGWFFPWDNGSVKVGEDLYQKQRKEPYEKARAEMLSCPSYFEHAESSAAILITNLVKEVNREVNGLVVEIEFMD